MLRICNDPREHVQPLIKHAMACQHEQIHCGSWPTFFPEDPKNFLYGLMPTMHKTACRAYAAEVGCFYIAATSPFTANCIDAIAGGNENIKQALQLGGGSSLILDAHGKDLVSQIDPAAEGILYAEIDLAERYLPLSVLDTVGHYSRPDVFKVSFDQRPKHLVVVGGHGEERKHAIRKLRGEQFGSVVGTDEQTSGEIFVEGFGVGS